MKSSTQLLFCALFSIPSWLWGRLFRECRNSTPPPPPATMAVIAGPEAFVIPPGGQASLLSWVEGSANQAVTWSSAAGQVTQAGMFTAPATSGPLTVLATSVASPASTAEIQVFVEDDGKVLHLAKGCHPFRPPQHLLPLAFGPVP
ncbi:MAG: hypothetical protein IPP78_01785 [Holophagaceae bacterium]|nr:hypothetical protein [Holophagaceae bacterium]